MKLPLHRLRCRKSQASPHHFWRNVAFGPSGSSIATTGVLCKAAPAASVRASAARRSGRETDPWASFGALRAT
eukprot:1884214-Prymnesium_polylepis.1